MLKSKDPMQPTTPIHDNNTCAYALTQYSCLRLYSEIYFDTQRCIADSFRACSFTIKGRQVTTSLSSNDGISPLTARLGAHIAQYDERTEYLPALQFLNLTLQEPRSRLSIPGIPR